MMAVCLQLNGDVCFVHHIHVYRVLQLQTVCALQCDGCRALVHMDCYGVEGPPQGQSWLCDVCSLGVP